jgi:hypothetical protein
MDIDVHEFAVLDDGRRLTLHQERGFSTSGTYLTADQVEESVLMTVLPDDFEVTGEDHPWEWLVSLIRNHGVAVTPLQLKTAGYVVEFGPRLAALLESEASGNASGPRLQATSLAAVRPLSLALVVVLVPGGGEPHGSWRATATR